MIRQVQAPDGRGWTVRSEINWFTPALGEEFEHDVAPGYTSAFMLGLVAALLVVVLLAWMPNQVVVPAWLLFLVVLAVVLVALRWLLRRPWTLVAEVPADEEYGLPGERWVGMVTGPREARHETRLLTENILTRAGPDEEGPLQPID